MAMKQAGCSNVSATAADLVPKGIVVTPISPIMVVAIAP